MSYSRTVLDSVVQTPYLLKVPLGLQGQVGASLSTARRPAGGTRRASIWKSLIISCGSLIDSSSAILTKRNSCMSPLSSKWATRRRDLIATNENTVVWSCSAVNDGVAISNLWLQYKTRSALLVCFETIINEANDALAMQNKTLNYSFSFTFFNHTRYLQIPVQCTLLNVLFLIFLFDIVLLLMVIWRIVHSTPESARKIFLVN